MKFTLEILPFIIPKEDEEEIPKDPEDISRFQTIMDKIKDLGNKIIHGIFFSAALIVTLGIIVAFLEGVLKR